MKTHKVAQMTVKEDTGISQSVTSEWLSGRYTGDNAKVWLASTRSYR